MEQLSSCYFCGAALDAQVDPYQVIPPHLEPTSDQQRAVSLCPSCRQKLGHIVETVVAATDASAAVTTDDVTTPDPAGDLVRNESTSGSDDGGSTAETETTASETPADEQRAAGDDTRTASDDQRSADDGSPEYDAAEGTEQRHSTPSRTEQRQNGTHDQSPATTHDPKGGIRESPSDPLADDAESSADQSPDPSESRDDQQTAGQSASPAADDAGGEHQSQGTDAQTAADDDGPSLTALEYNKVMRLLQNRDFPVERAEIEAVATNAYEISEQEFDAIIDAAIDRGLIGEEGDQLISGD